MGKEKSVDQNPGLRRELLEIEQFVRTEAKGPPPFDFRRLDVDGVSDSPAFKIFPEIKTAFVNGPLIRPAFAAHEKHISEFPDRGFLVDVVTDAPMPKDVIIVFDGDHEAQIGAFPAFWWEADKKEKGRHRKGDRVKQEKDLPALKGQKAKNHSHHEGHDGSGGEKTKSEPSSDQSAEEEEKEEVPSEGWHVQSLRRM
jgi:hypothetical protein